MPVVLPRGVEVAVGNGEVKVKGPKGEVRVPFRREHVQVELAEGKVQIGRKAEVKSTRALHGLTRSLIANAVRGVTQGFSKNLDVFGVGFRAEVQGRRLTLHVGYSHPVIYEAPAGIELALGEPQGGAQARIVVRGVDKQQVGQVAADIRFKRKPEPYKGKGIRYEGEIIHWKAGKTAVSAS
jgi:large subunit ribosomal protein L6